MNFLLFIPYNIYIVQFAPAVGIAHGYPPAGGFLDPYRVCISFILITISKGIADNLILHLTVQTSGLYPEKW
jgi:hypothetical protein